MHTFVHENIKNFMQGFRYDAHPMGMLLASVGTSSSASSASFIFLPVIILFVHSFCVVLLGLRQRRLVPLIRPGGFDESCQGNIFCLHILHNLLSTADVQSSESMIQFLGPGS